MKVYTEAAIKPDKPLRQYCIGTEYYVDEEGKKFPRCETLDADVNCDKYCGVQKFDAAGDVESQQQCKCVDLSEACAEGTVENESSVTSVMDKISTFIDVNTTSAETDTESDDSSEKTNDEASSAGTRILKHRMVTFALMLQFLF
jgi:hypothetical protein